ncbi:hypothetical protein AMAG_19913 [Allomyces macrogynus ATCC 38327]|uniref:Uncharacterized protein n=1 Tax=Allomyces macrogynus (strain ATCC 38327) TaxID=578462 RepID=A0A0L0T3B0_ALLM3|nr:hypothetical protein AMAG_19913 [Allomyces macrogynus ATCC 38327]|eukprot:KNE69333.1 hypothetical protein AMAG_19913 [Allomyces macrogynus ATCC 38327]
MSRRQRHRADRHGPRRASSPNCPVQPAPRTEPSRAVPPPVLRPVSPEPLVIDAPRPAAQPAAAPSVPAQPLANDASAADDAMVFDEPAPQPTLAALHLAGRKAAKRSIDLSGASVMAAAPAKRRAVAASALDGTAQSKAATVLNGDARPVVMEVKELEPVPLPPRSTRSATRMAAATDATAGPALTTAAVPEPKAVPAVDPSIKPGPRTSKQGAGKSKRSTDPAASAAPAPAPPAEVPPPPAAPTSACPPARFDPGAPQLNLSAVVGAAVATGPTKSLSLSEQLSAMALELEDATQGVADRNAASAATVPAAVPAAAAVSVAVAASTAAAAVPTAPALATNAVPKSTQALNKALVGTSKPAASVAAPKPMSLVDAVMQYSAKMDKAARNEPVTDSSQDPHMATRLRSRATRESDARQQPRKLPATASTAAPPPPTPSRLRMPSAVKPGQVLPPRAPAAKAITAATAGAHGGRQERFARD